MLVILRRGRGGRWRDSVGSGGKAKLFRDIRLGFLAAAVNSGSALQNFVQQETESAKSLSSNYLDVDARGLL
jgi:hypothetical protein